MGLNEQNGKTLAGLEEWRRGIDEKLTYIMRTLDNAFEPEGFCSRSRGKIGWLATMVGIQWLLVAALVVAIIGEWVKK
jgi:hypothetical protein